MAVVKAHERRQHNRECAGLMPVLPGMLLSKGILANKWIDVVLNDSATLSIGQSWSINSEIQESDTASVYPNLRFRVISGLRHNCSVLQKDRCDGNLLE